jgi:hypothetical protein
VEDGDWESRLLLKVKKTTPLSYNAKKKKITVFLNATSCSLVDHRRQQLTPKCSQQSNGIDIFFRDITPCSPL